MTEPGQRPASFDRRLTRWLRPGAWLIALVKLALAGWHLVRPVLRAALELLLALILIFEEWGWRPLADALARLRRLRPWALFEDWVQRLPPYPSLLVFALPSLLLLPLKLASLWLIAKGQVLVAGGLFALAKVAGTALVARLFMLLRPKLMAIWWFARVHDWLMPWKEALYAQIRASWAWRYGRIVKARIRARARDAWARWRPRLAALRAQLRPRLAALVQAARARAAAAWARLKALYPTSSSRR